MQRILSHLLLSGVVGQASMVTSSTMSDSGTNFGKNVTGNYTMLITQVKTVIVTKKMLAVLKMRS